MSRYYIQFIYIFQFQYYNNFLPNAKFVLRSELPFKNSSSSPNPISDGTNYEPIAKEKRPTN